MENQVQNSGNVLYDANDMVKAGCNDCKDCSDCCTGMGESIILDPYDIRQLETNLSCSFAQLLQEKIELHVEEGLILPHLKMQGSVGRCGFLDENGRCGIHAFRPGLCRLFPLGRKYENGRLRYFILQEVCPYAGHTKIKVKKWLEVPEIRKYETFLATWHDLRRTLQKEIAKYMTFSGKEGQPLKEEQAADSQKSEAWIKEINMQFLQIFYEKPYGPEDFYVQFEERLAAYQFKAAGKAAIKDEKSDKK